MEGALNSFLEYMSGDSPNHLLVGIGLIVIFGFYFLVGMTKNEKKDRDKNRKQQVHNIEQEKKILEDNIKAGDDLEKIRNSVDKTAEKSKHRQLAIQLFLHLAQEFDQQSWELRQQLNRFQVQQQALQAFLRLDQTEEDQHFVSADADPFPGSKEDPGGFMIEHRMFAWKALFDKDPDPSNLLFTDSPVAHAWLLEAASERIRVSTFNVPCSAPPANNLPWKAPLEELFQSLLTTPWSEKLRQRVERTTRQIEDMIESWKRSSTKPGNKMTAFHWHLVPGIATRSLLNQRCGFRVDSQGASGPENSIIGLVEHGAQ